MSRIFNDAELENLLQQNGTILHSDGAFTCPHCRTKKSAFHAVRVSKFKNHQKNFQLVTTECSVCHNTSVYLEQQSMKINIVATNNNFDTKSRQINYVDKLIFPDDAPVDVPDCSIDMPKNVAPIYNEAASVIKLSPRSSVALLRLALQQLVDDLVDGSDNLDQKIGKLVKEGLPKLIQQMLDSIRIIGNNAVHPGQIDFRNPKDSKDIAIALFTMINSIVQFEITDKNTLDHVYSLIPEGQKEHIKQRDTKK